MTFRTVTRLASAAVVGSVASLALATPAGALVEPGGPGGTSSGSTGIPTSADTSWELLPIAIGAAGGLALAGIGFAAATGVRRRNDQMAHPA
jgi:hypothetical protein